MSPDFARVRAAVSDEVRRRLRDAGSALVTDAFVERQFLAQVTGILSTTFARLGWNVPARFDRATATGPIDVAGRSADIGEARARQNIHPVDSLQAAAVLFDVALAELVANSPGDTSEATIAGALHQAIMTAVIPASIAYVNVLLERLAVAHSEERLGISRELHDRVAHSIAAGIQRVELSGRGADETLRPALDLFTDALGQTRAIALELRHFVGDKALDGALRDYVDDIERGGPAVVIETEGEPYRFSPGAQEESFIIVREAIHNALRHSGARLVTVRVSWAPDAVAVTVSDDGHGFRHADVRSGALGLITAQERAELIGADLRIDPGAGRGTSVVLTVPNLGAAG